MESVPPPPNLFHYTNAAGLAGIVEGGCLWLSDIFTLNDPSEITYALQAAVRYTAEQASSKEMVILSGQLRHFASQEAARAVANYFVCSFSAESDDLGQWRAYADGGRGFALEFDTSALEQAFTKLDGVPVVNHSTFPVDYSEDNLRALVGALIQLLADKISFVRKVMPSSAQAYGAYMSDLLMITALHLYRTSLFFKHSAYRHEREYRFLGLFDIHDPLVDLKTRSRGSLHIRYKELDWRALAPTALKGVRIGPAAEASARDFAVSVLEKAGLVGIPITTSTVPFRT
jgi:hypothetical protein